MKTENQNYCHQLRNMIQHASHNKPNEYQMYSTDCCTWFVA